MSDYLKLLNNFETLGLMNMREHYPELLDSYHNENRTLTSILIELTDNEIAFQTKKKLNRALTRARFPTIKTFEGFDFSFQPSIKKNEMLELQIKYLCKIFKS